jgi:hypothetical protein
MLVSVQDKIDTILDEDGLEGSLAFRAWRRADVPRTMASNDDPGSLLAIHSSKIRL